MHNMEKINQILKTFGLLRKDDPFCRVIFTPPLVFSVTQTPLGQRGLTVILGSKIGGFRYFGTNTLSLTVFGAKVIRDRGPPPPS